MFAKREILNTDVHKTRDFLVRYLRSETKYLPQNCVLWQKVIYYDKQHELNFYPNTFIFFKNIFLNSDLCKMYWEIFKKKYNIKSDHFLSHFPTRNSQIWHLKIISWRSARKNKENVHLRFFIFETSSQRFLSNMLRDFQKSWNYEKLWR